MRYREQEPEEDSEPRALEVVFDDEPDGVLGQLRVRLRERRVGARVARREKQVVAGCLSAVAEAVGGEVPEPARCSPEDQSEEPGEEGRHRGNAAERCEAVGHEVGG